MELIAIYGAGGLGREVLMLVRQINLHRPQWHILGYFDDKFPEVQSVHGVPIIGNLEVLNRFDRPVHLVIAIGQPEAKQQIVSQIHNPNIRYARLVHPSVQLEPFQQVSIGEGSIIGAGNIFTTDITIGRHVLVNLGCTIGHDVCIEDYVSLMPGVHVSGNITIGESVYIGTGAVLINQIKLGRGAVVGAGAVVRESVAEGNKVMGVPARAAKNE